MEEHHMEPQAPALASAWQDTRVRYATLQIHALAQRMASHVSTAEHLEEQQETVFVSAAAILVVLTVKLLELVAQD